MSVFSEILIKLFPDCHFPAISADNINTLLESYNHFDTYHINIQFLYNMVYLPYNKNKNLLNKFDILYNIILINKCLSVTQINYNFSKFSNAQRSYNALRHFANFYKKKYAKKYEIEHDMCFTLFASLSPSILISLYENNILYTFRISDIINIINKSLTNSDDFFSDPQKLRNPYTNLNFSLSNHYNIYFKIKNSNFIMPILLHQFFVSNFNLEHFKNNNECLIRDKIISYFIKGANMEQKHDQILRMFYSHYNSVTFELDLLFPKKKVVQIFNNYLKAFLLQEYSLNPQIRQYNKSFLELHLRLFSQYNPNFGKRLFVRRRRNNSGNPIYHFNDRILYDPFTNQHITYQHTPPSSPHTPGYDYDIMPINLFPSDNDLDI